MRHDHSTSLPTERRETKRTYHTPNVEELGSLARITAGPECGTIDQLGGGSGGFETCTPPPSS